MSMDFKLIFLGFDIEDEAMRQLLVMIIIKKGIFYSFSPQILMIIFNLYNILLHITSNIE